MSGSADSSKRGGSGREDSQAAPLNILIVAPQVPPAVGGVETHTRQLAAGLVRRGHKVTLVGASRAPCARPDVPKDPTGAARPTPGAGAQRAPQVVVVTRASRAPSGLPPVLWASRLRALYQEERFDVAHLHSYHQPHAAVADLALPPSLPRVFTGHYHGDGHTLAARIVHPTYRRVVGVRLVGRADRVVCVSEAEAELVRRDFPGCDPVVVPNGVELPAAATPYPAPAGSVVVLSVGRLERYKGVDRIIAAVSHSDDPRMMLVVVGDGPDRSRLKALAQRAPEGRVHLLGRVSDSVLASLWARADVFATASRKEAFGLTVATALTLQVPTVASDIAAHVEVAAGRTRPGMYLAGCDDPASAWSAALSAAAAGPRPSGTFLSWGEVSADLEKIYREVVSDARHKR